MDENDPDKNQLRNKADQKRAVQSRIDRKKALGEPVPAALQEVADEARKGESRSAKRLLDRGTNVLQILDLITPKK